MSLRSRLMFRTVRLFAYHGLITHPYGLVHARERYTATGGVRED